MDYFRSAQNYLDEAISIRRHIHENPELSQHEDQTVRFILRKLKEYDIDYIDVENGGVLGFIGKEYGKTVMLRADIDALPVSEHSRNSGGIKKVCISHKSGISHVCGHDAHTAMLLLAGKMLKENERALNGRVVLFFERAEEAGGNILYLLRHIYKNKIRIDGCCALHVNGSMNTGTISLNEGAVNTGGFGFEISIIGKGGHGSQPNMANNPIDCFVDIYQNINLIPIKYIPPDEMCVFSIGTVNAGTKKNIIPESLNFSGTARFFRHEIGEIFRRELLNTVENITKAHGCKYKIISAVGPTLPVVNNTQCVKIAINSASCIFGTDKIISKKPEMSSESFSAAQKLYPGVYGFLGIRNTEKGTGGELHSPEFDIDENAMAFGAAYEAKYAEDFLNYNGDITFEPYSGTPDMLYKEINYKVG